MTDSTPSPTDDPNFPFDPTSPNDEYRLILNMHVRITDRTALEAATLHLRETDEGLVLPQQWLSSRLVEILGHPLMGDHTAEGFSIESMFPWMIPVAADGSVKGYEFPGWPAIPRPPEEPNEG